MDLIGVLFLCATIIKADTDPQFQNIQIYKIDSDHNIQKPYHSNPFLSSLNTINQIPPDTSTDLTATSCNSYWSYQYNFNENWGRLVISKPNIKKSVVRIILSLAAQLSSRYVGEISLLKDRQSTVNDIANGLPIYYRVRFPLQNPVPKLTAIYYNDQLICSAPKEMGQLVTTITLDHTLFTGLSNPPQKPYTITTVQPEPSKNPPRTTEKQTVPEVSSNPVTTNIDGLEDFKIDFECGLTDYQAPTTTGLVIGGKTANRGQFPWLAAYYHNSVQDYTGFICGGSLISKKIIVTAAHCIQEKKSNLIRKAEEATFYIGKHNLEVLSGEKYYIISGVSQFILHRDWDYNDDKYDADIAIAVLSRTIPFNKFVKPICLWSAADSHDLIGKLGIVVGWGKTEQHAISTASPKWTEIPVVDLLTCIRSNDAFNKLTSDRTFCAGNRKGDSGPCSGDSGGGFVLQNNKKWFLRGIISSALYDQVLGTCDSKNYAVFTDTSGFTRWLQEHIQTYG